MHNSWSVLTPFMISSPSFAGTHNEPYPIYSEVNISTKIELRLMFIASLAITIIPVPITTCNMDRVPQERGPRVFQVFLVFLL